MRVIPVIQNNKNKNVIYYLLNEFLLLEYMKHMNWDFPEITKPCGKYHYKKGP